MSNIKLETKKHTNNSKVTRRAKDIQIYQNYTNVNVSQYKKYYCKNIVYTDVEMGIL